MSLDKPQNVYRLVELNEHVKRVMALNFPESVWVKAEIAEVDPYQGHLFLQLVEKSDTEDMVIAQNRAILWNRKFKGLKRVHGHLLEQIFHIGHELKLAVQLRYDERYGFALHVDDVDLSYTIGQLQIKKQQTIKELRDNGLIDKNKKKILPKVPQRIAVFASETSAGYQDFVDQLQVNPYGYRFACRLFPMAVQGKFVAATFKDAMNRLNPDRFDCAVIVRGGGAKIDLSGFDLKEVGEGIAGAPVPILTGIGHDIDETVADLVAHTVLKTPTAVADFLVQRVAFFEQEMLQSGSAIYFQAERQLNQEKWTFSALENALAQQLLRLIDQEKFHLESFQQKIAQEFKFCLARESAALESMDREVDGYDVGKILKRGFSLTTKDGILIKDTTQLNTGDVIQTKLQNGVFNSKVS